MTYYLPLPPQAYLNQPTFIEYRVTVPVSVIGDVDPGLRKKLMHPEVCLLYTSDAADDMQ